MKKNSLFYGAASLDELERVSAEYAQEHFEELMERVNRENTAILIGEDRGAVVLVPYWWYQMATNIE